jgi:hypothetical protein
MRHIQRYAPRPICPRAFFFHTAMADAGARCRVRGLSHIRHRGSMLVIIDGWCYLYTALAIPLALPVAICLQRWPIPSALPGA